MAIYYCVDKGTEENPDLGVAPTGKGQFLKHVHRVGASDELVFYGLNSCLGILFLLNTGERIGGHVVELYPKGSGVENSESVLKEMKSEIPRGAWIQKVVFIYNARVWGFNRLLALIGSPPYLGIRYGDGTVDAMVTDRITVRKIESVVEAKLADGKTKVRRVPTGAADDHLLTEIGGIEWNEPQH